MNVSEFDFVRPKELDAIAPPEERGVGRDGVRLLVSDPRGESHRHFRELGAALRAGDLLVTNESATVSASLPAEAYFGSFLLNVSTSYGRGVWLAEPRWGVGAPGPLPLGPGDPFRVGELQATVVAAYPGSPRLLFVRAEGDLRRTMSEIGRPIRYGYVPESYPLSAYQTLFSRVPGSAEMPSAGRPFTPRVLEDLENRGILTAPIILHAGVSSIELDGVSDVGQALYPEPFEVSVETAQRVNIAHREGHRVIAVGTTVVRALESAWECDAVRPTRGFTRLFVRPGRELRVVDGLLTGFHDPKTSHLALLYAFAGPARIRSAYEEAIRNRYLWHEFGDSHLILRS